MLFDSLLQMLAFSSANIRGILLSVIGAMFTVGSILVFSTGPSVSYSGTGYIGLAMSIVHLLSLFWIPESPIYYALQGSYFFFSLLLK